MWCEETLQRGGTVGPDGGIRFPLAGEVAAAGLTLAGGITPFAKESKIKILRENNGSQRVFHFNYHEVERGDHTRQNIQLIPGDTVVVP